MLKILKVNEEGTQYLKILIYGMTGVGKTYMSATSPDPIFFDAEGGLLSIRDKKNIDCIRIKSFEDLSNGYEFLKNEKHKYKTVVLDSITEIHQVCYEEVINRFKHEIAEDRDWLRIQTKMRHLLRAFRNLDMHVVFTALAEDVKDGTSGVLIKKPELYGAMANEICAYMDIVGYLFVKEDTEKKTLSRYFMTQPTERFYAKDRWGKLERYEEPDIEKILQKIFKKEVK